MKEYVVSARKYRPGTFGEVIGQAHITNTLKNALKTNQLAHAFLFSGPRGIGKTTCARILAKAINCDNPPGTGEPCNECNTCKSFHEGRSFVIHELDAASNNSVDDIRGITEQVRYIPPDHKKRVFIIDEVHMLSQAAFNAFLKTLEEPPPHVVFILATTERHKILPTILSRCQKFDFRRLKADEIADQLETICKTEKVKYERDGLQIIAIKADGALRDALSIFDQLRSFSGGNLSYSLVLENLNVLDYDFYFQATTFMMEKDHGNLLVLLNKIVESGFEPREFLFGLVEHFRNLLIASEPKTVNLLETADNVRAKYLQFSKQIPLPQILHYFDTASASEGKLRYAVNQRLLVELTLMKLAGTPEGSSVNPVPVPEKKKPDVGTREKNAGTRLVVSVQNSNSDPFQIPTTLGQIRAGMKIPSKKAGIEEESVPEFDEKVTEDQDKFFKSLKETAEWLQATRPSLASILKSENAKLQHNRWTQIVENDSALVQLQNEKNIVVKMREMLSLPTLFLEIRVEKNYENQNDKLPYTTQEKLEAMKARNPHLAEFMRRFDVMVDY